MNNFILQLIAALNKAKSKVRIKQDIKQLGDFFVYLTGRLRLTKTDKKVKDQLKGRTYNINLTPNVNNKAVNNAVKQAVNSAKNVAKNNPIPLDFDVKKGQLINSLKIFARENNKLFSNQEMTAKYNQIFSSANLAKNSKDLRRVKNELSAFRTELKATNNDGMNWISRFKESIKRYTNFFTGASFVYTMVGQLRNAATEAKTLDDRLVDLQKVTDEISDRNALYKYFDKAMSKAKELNVKVESLIEAITEIKKLGWSLEDAELGGKWSTILQNVGDVSSDTAIGSIKTAIASFDTIGGYGNDQMDKKLEAYVDLINEMSNKYSIDAEGLAESIRLSAGTLTEAHTSIEQATVMFATANKYYNDPSYLGNTAKVGSLRMRASSGDTDAVEELQEMGEEVDDLATATSNLREQLKALTGVDIMVDDHTFKSYYDQLYEISQVMDSLDDTSRANVLETIFGKSRSAAGAAILSGMKESAEAYETAINSAGSATNEYQIWMQSADAACQKFSNTLTETYQSIISGNTVRDIANLGSAVLSLANDWGIVEGTLKGIVAIEIVKFLTTGTMALMTATKQLERYGIALKAAKDIPVNGNLAQRFQYLKTIADATQNLTTEQLKNVLSSKNLTQQDRIRILQMQGLGKEMITQKLTEMNLINTTNAQTAANNAQVLSVFNLKAAMMGLLKTIQAMILSNPIGVVLMAFSLGFSAVSSAISKHNQSVEDFKQKTKEAADTASSTSDEISELANKYVQLSDAIKTDASAKDDLMSTQTELLKKLGLEGESVDELINKYGSLSEAIKQASIDSLKNQQIDLIAGVDVAETELFDTANKNFNKSIVAMGENAGKAWQVLEDAGIISSGTHTDRGGEWFLQGDNKTLEGIIQNYETLERAVSALSDSGIFTPDELSKNELFQEIYKRYNSAKESMEGYNSAIDNLNKNVAQQFTLQALQGNEIPKTTEEFETFKQQLIDTAIASKQFIGNEEDIANVIENYLTTLPEFQELFSDSLQKGINKISEISSKIPKISFSDMFDLNSLDSTKKKLLDLSTSGELSAETITSTEEYKALLDELGISAEKFVSEINKFNLDYLNDNYDEFSELITRVANGEKLTFEETTKLIAANNELAGNVKVTADGYTFAEDAIISLKNTYAKDYNTAVANQINKTQIVIEETEKRIKAYQLENVALLNSGIAGAVTRTGKNYNRLEELGYSKEEVNEYYDYLKDRGKLMNLQEQLAGLKYRAKDYKNQTETSSSKDSSNAIDDAYQKELKLLEFYHDTLQMNDEDYYANKLELAKKYYGNSEAYAEEYRDKIKEIFTELNSYLLNKAQKVVDAVSDYYQYQIDDIQRENDKLNDQKDVYDNVISGIVSAYEDKVDAIQKAIDKLEEETDLMDSALSGIDNMYSDEIDRLNEQKQSIQDIIDAMQDENDERDRAIQLQKAQAALDKANSQKTKKVIDVNGQAKYVVDDEAVKSAQEELDNQTFENTISELEKQQDALDDTISKLEEYQKKWSDISGLFEKNKNENAAKAFFGDDYVDKLLYADPETLKEFQDFKLKYVSNQNQIETNNKIMEQYSTLKDEWSNLSDAYEKNQNKIIAMNQFGLTSESELLNLRVSNLQSFVTSYQSIQAKIYNNEKVIKSLEEKKQAWEDATTAYKKDLAEIIARQAGFIDEQGELLDQSDENMTKFVETYNLLQIQFADESQMFGESARSIVGNAKDICDATKEAMEAIRKYQELTGSIPSFARTDITQIESLDGAATGGKVIKGGTILTGEEGYEAYIRDNKLTIVGQDGMELVNAKAGDQVLNHKDTKKLLNGLTPYVPAYANGSISLEEIGRNLTKSMSMYTPSISMPKLPDVNNITNKMGNNITVEMTGGIHLHGVQDVDGLAKAIDANLVNAINHRINQRR